MKESTRGVVSLVTYGKRLWVCVLPTRGIGIYILNQRNNKKLQVLSHEVFLIGLKKWNSDFHVLDFIEG